MEIAATAPTVIFDLKLAHNMEESSADSGNFRAI